MTDDNEEWGPWAEHDGNGCPCVGCVVMTERLSGEIEGPLIAGASAISKLGSANVPGSAWVHVYHPGFSGNWIMKYRVRTPRALRQLRDMVETLPVTHKTEVDA